MKENRYEILIVDDNPENLRVLCEILGNEGYGVRAAKNGKQALASIDLSEPDLLLLDIHMPEMDGFDVCKTIKADRRYNNLPIIFLSALDDSFNKIQGFRAGAVDYMTKPFDLEEVKARVKTHLRLRSSLLEVNQLKLELEEKSKELEILKKKLSG